MNFKHYFISAIIFSMFLFSCSSEDKKPDWEGIYTGVLPCASCPGIETTLQLNADKTFKLETTYQEREGTFTEEGSFELDKKTNIITLSIKDAGSESGKYLIGENRVTQLDMEGKLITGNLADAYVLKKVADFEEKYWKLTKIRGKEVKFDSNQDREPHIIFKSHNSMAHGNAGCNSFFGKYELKNRQIKFDGMGATMMACPDMTVENEVLKILNGTLDYKVIDDETFVLSNETGELLRFEVVWLY